MRPLLLLLALFAAQATASCFDWYTIKNEDTFEEIASALSVSVHDLTKFNPNVDPENLRAGDELCIKKARGKRSSCAAYHVVVKGDTCYDISTSSSISLSHFQSLNKNIDCDRLQIGQRVCVMAR